MADSMFQLTGLVSGMDWGAMVDKIIEKAKAPIQLMEIKKDKLELKMGLYEELSQGLRGLRTASTTLKLESTYKQKQAEFAVISPSGGNANSIVKAKVTTAAYVDQWRIKVDQVATYQRNISERFDSVSESLGVEGKFRIYIGQSWADVTVESGDSLRDINQKLGKLTDQFGNSLPIEAKIVDNRLSIQSSATGLGASGPKTGETLTMAPGILKDASDPSLGYDYITYLPRAADIPNPDYNASLPEGPGNEKTIAGSYPPAIKEIKKDDTNRYLEGVHFTYDSTNGTITWLSDSRPAQGETFNVTYDYAVEVSGSYTRDTTIGTPISIPDGPTITGNQYTYVVEDADGKRYRSGVDFTYDPSTQEITWLKQGPASGKTYSVRAEIADDYKYQTNYNEYTLEDIEGVLVSANKLNGGLGLMANSSKAQDAIFEIDGVQVTRSSNTIDDLIGGVTLELVGAGDVVMDITSDMEPAITAWEQLITSYNEVIDWINKKLSEVDESAQQTYDSVQEEYDVVRQKEELQRRYGILHGDSLLWSIKSQMRNLMMNPFSIIPGAISSKKMANTTEALGISGKFLINVQGLQGRITVEPSDSLTKIQKKIEEAVDVNKSGSGKALPISVTIRDGQLVIESTSAEQAQSTVQHNVARDKTKEYDVLPFAPVSTAPISGKVKVTSGDKVYTEGSDFVLTSVTGADGKIEHQIKWISSNRPVGGVSYSVDYTYNARALSIEPEAGQTALGENLSLLGFHADQSYTTLASVGISTYKEDGSDGKTGQLQFDADKFMEAMTRNEKEVSALMVAAATQIDTLMANLVENTQVEYGKYAVGTKGRVAGAINSLQSEINTLTRKISEEEQRLKDRQANMYKQYSQMEQQMAKLQEQMSSFSSALQQLNGSSS